MNGELLATIRKTAGLTQVEMAERLKVSQQLVQKYETGKRRIQPYIITRLYIEFGADYIEEVRAISDKYLSNTE